nr:MAG TPA: hypothetical protein [Crassvirales sp.]
MFYLNLAVTIIPKNLITFQVIEDTSFLHSVSFRCKMHN